MRNGRGPRTILRFIAIIAMNLFTINCACYIAVTVLDFCIQAEQALDKKEDK